MKKFYLLIVIAFLSVNVFGQAPGWAWAKSGVGNNNDQANNVSTDASGNVYVTGYFGSPTITFGTITLTSTGSGGIFTVKYDPSGNVIWAKSAGGTGSDAGTGVATDAFGNVIITGTFSDDSITFGTTILVNTSNTGYPAIFIVKYDFSGNVIWAKSEGGNTGIIAASVATDSIGNVFITGNFTSPAITIGTTTLTNAGLLCFYIVKYDASGNMIWANSTGGGGTQLGNWIATDLSGNVFVSGSFSSDTISFGATILTMPNNGFFKFFIVKYDGSGNVIWAKSASGDYFNSCATSIATDANGNIVCTGSFITDTITFGTTTLTNAGGGAVDIFITKYDASGNVMWAKSAGGIHEDRNLAVATDASGNIVITGKFNSPSITFGTTTLTNTGIYTIYIVKFDTLGNVIWAKSAGGINDDLSRSVTADASGNVIIVGGFRSPAITFGTTTLINAGSGDVFVAKLDASTGIEEQQNETTFTIFPNPFTSQTTITFNEEQKNTSIKIMNLLGECVLVPPPFLQGGGKGVVIDMTGFAKGIYFVRIESFDKLRMTPIVVNRKLIKN